MKLFYKNFILFLIITTTLHLKADDNFINNADDICYQKPSYSGLLCFSLGGLFEGGIGCTSSYPIKNQSANTLRDVHIIYDEDHLASGSFGSHCATNPNGTCQTKHSIDFGPFGFFNQVTDYSIGRDIPSNDESNSISSTRFISAAIFNTEYLYASYTKDGKKYRGRIAPCRETKHQGWKPFSRRKALIAPGNMVSIGNTFVVAPTTQRKSMCDTYTNGSYIDPVTTNNARKIYCHYNVDGNQGEAATRAELIIPHGVKILWAGIYWQALTAHKRDYSNFSIHIRNDNADNIYHTVPADEVNYQSAYSNNIDPAGSSKNATSADIYSAFADVTDLFNQEGWSDGNYTVASPDILEGNEDHFGVYGAWNLIVIYKDSSQSYKSFTVFDGWQRVSRNDSDVNVDVHGFYTPKQTPINAKVTFFAAEGDYNINGDKLLATRESDNSTYEFLNSNNPDKNNQTFSSLINTTGLRVPSEQNNNGIDIQSYDIGTGTDANLLSPKQTSMHFEFTSNQDLYFPSVITFATEVLAPKICYDYTYGQNGHYMTAPNLEHPSVDGFFNKNTPLDIKLYFQNQENSDIIINNLKVDVDPIDNNATYRPDSVFVTPPKGTQEHINDSSFTVSPTRNYIRNIPIGDGDFGSLDYFYTYYSLNLNRDNISHMLINAILKYSLSVNANGEIIDLGNQISSIQNMTMCRNTVPYQPRPGRFNVVQSGEGKTDDPYFYFNIPTQVVNRIGNFKVEAMDPATDYNTSKAVTQPVDVNISIVNMAGFHYTTATCTDPDSTIRIGHPVTTHFNTNDRLVPLNKTDMSNADIFSWASKNAAFRIRYKDENASIKTTCSRDNFAIRPEAIKLTLIDQNQTTSVIENNITQNTTTTPVNLAAGYSYKLYLNTTDYFNHMPTYGYITNLPPLNITWTGKSASLCNDINNRFTSVFFLNGIADTNVTINQVGKFAIDINDTTWTRVDSETQEHHISPYFKSGSDCSLNSTIVQDKDNDSAYNGCNISSVHHYNSQNYTPINTIFYPYKFDLSSLAIKYGLGNSNYNPNAFAYDANLSNNKDVNMSFYFTGKTIARGYNGSNLSNFTASCYAQSLNLDLNRTLIKTPLKEAFQYRYIALNNSSRVIRDTNATDLNNSLTPISMHNSDFTDDLNGSANTRLHLNFKRKSNIPYNPQQIIIKDYNVTMPISINAHGSVSYKPHGNKSFVTKPLKFYYGRTHATRQRFEVPTDAPYTTDIYYEVYCYDNGVVNDCNKTLLPNGTNSKHSDDLRWYINTNHNTHNDGNITSAHVVDSVYGKVTEASRDNTHNDITKVNLLYDGSVGYPYKTTMENNASDWLIYNPDNPNAKRNKFSVEFYKAGTIWNGEHETTTTTKGANTAKTNRRVMW